MLPQQIKTNGGSLRKNNRKRAKSLEYSTDTLLTENLLFIIAIIIGVLLIIALFVNFIIPFKEERDYIKMKMEHSYEEEEYRYWRRELKHLYLQSIPLIGRFFR